MTNSILVTATQQGSGKSLVTLGLCHVLEHSLPRVGYFKPIGYGGSNGLDPDAILMKAALGLEASPEDMAPLTIKQVSEALSRGTFDQLLDRILEAYERIAEQSDFVICEGTDYFGALSAFEFDINVDLAKTLGSPILLVAVDPSTADEPEEAPSVCCESLIQNISLIKDSFDEKATELFGVIVNRVRRSSLRETHLVVQKELDRLGIKLLGTIPRTDMLSKLRVEEVAASLEAEVMSGHERLNSLIQEVVVAAMSVENVLERLNRGALVVVPGDRDDVLLALAAAYSSPAAPSPSGVVMTGGLEPRKNVKKLFFDATSRQMPVLKVPDGTYQAAVKVSAIKPSLHGHQQMRIEVAKSLVERYVNVETVLARAVIEPTTRRVTPKQFTYSFIQQARRDRRHIVLPEGEEERILRAAAILNDRKIVELTLLGNEERVRQNIARLDIEFPEIRVIDPATSEWREPFAKRYVELRSPRKTPTWDVAYEQMGDPTYFGTMMVHEGRADGMVSGSINTTAHTLRPALEFIKTQEGYSIASSVFFMCLPDQVVVYGDCAVNTNPNAEQLADIALASAETARAFFIEPYVAMLSYSTGASGKGSDVDKVREATELVKRRAPDLPIEGPIQYDAAIDPMVAETKLPGSRVAGVATVFIFPDLNSGNNTYKAVQRAAKAIAVGPVMQGLRKPVNDLSRGCTVADIVNTVAITAVQAQRA